MKIEQALENLQNTLKELKPLLELVSIKVKELDLKTRETNIYPLIEADDWLKEFCKTKLQAYLRVYDRHPPERWESYKQMGILSQLTEGNLLLNLAKDARKSWRQRPLILKAANAKQRTDEETTPNEG